MRELRFTSCQAENSYETCRTIAQYLGETIAIPTVFIDQGSWRERMRALVEGEIQVGWICGTWYVEKQNGSKTTISLLAAPVPRGERYKNKPLYYSDVVVHRHSAFQAFADLQRSRWAYNEQGSHSGYNVVRYHLAKMGAHSGYFAKVIEAGSHLKAMEMILSGRVDAAAIDSTVLDIELQKNPKLQADIRVIDSLGPSPIPPWVISSSVPMPVRRAIRDAFLNLHQLPGGRQALHASGIASFRAVDDNHYEPIRHMMNLAQRVTL